MIPKCKKWTGQATRYAHVKRDGLALVVSKDDAGLVTAQTRTPCNLTQDLRHWGWMQNAWSLLPCRTTLLGELWMPGKRASDVKTAIIEVDPALRFDVFAIARCDARRWVRGAEIALADWSLKACADLCSLWGQRFIPWWVPDALPLACMLNEEADVYRGSDVEGYVFKDSNLSQWYKWKRTPTVDLVVTGFVEGNGKFLGMTGALRCSAFMGDRLIEVARVSGMDDATRLDISEDEARYLERVCEVAYQYVGNGGRLRHPRFVRWRDDKRAAECDVGQDPDLERYHASAQ